MTTETTDKGLTYAAGPPSRTLTLKERQRQEREGLILKAASELLLEKGYHDMSIEEIAARVGTSKGTIYLHFASKEDLVLALMEHGLRLSTQLLDDCLNKEGTPREKIMALFEHAYSNMSQISLQHAFRIRQAVMQNPELHARLVEKRKSFAPLMEGPREHIAQIIEEGKKAGTFDPEMPTGIMVSFLSSLTNPMSYHQFVVEQQLPPEEVIHYVSRIFFRGVAPEQCAQNPQNPQGHQGHQGHSGTPTDPTEKERNA